MKLKGALIVRRCFAAANSAFAYSAELKVSWIFIPETCARVLTVAVRQASVINPSLSYLGDAD